LKAKYIGRTVGYPTISAELTSYCLSLRPRWSIAEFCPQLSVTERVEAPACFFAMELLWPLKITF
jgi:hypothetical protein